MGYSKEDLERIGRNVASNWGAYLEKVKVKGNTVTFYCNEFGEKFCTELSINDLSEYDY